MVKENVNQTHHTPLITKLILITLSGKYVLGGKLRGLMLCNHHAYPNNLLEISVY